MPYFIFKIHPPRRLEPVARYDDYREARQHVRAMRAKSTSDDEYTVRMIHAANLEEGQRLLLERREPRPAGEDA